jgi:hypothetical protein
MLAVVFERRGKSCGRGDVVAACVSRILVLASALIGAAFGLSGPALAQAAAGATQAAAGATQEAPPPPPEELYQQMLDAGLWVSDRTLAVPAVAYSFAKNINGLDDRESATISTWTGVYQSGDMANVLFTVSGLDVVFSDVVEAREEAVCRHLNDGRWWCEADIERFKIRAAFYLERPPLGGEEEVVAGQLTSTGAMSAPPRR